MKMGVAGFWIDSGGNYYQKQGVREFMKSCVKSWGGGGSDGNTHGTNMRHLHLKEMGKLFDEILTLFQAVIQKRRHFSWELERRRFEWPVWGQGMHKNQKVCAREADNSAWNLRTIQFGTFKRWSVIFRATKFGWWGVKNNDFVYECWVF